MEWRRAAIAALVALLAGCTTPTSAPATIPTSTVQSETLATPICTDQPPLTTDVPQTSQPEEFARTLMTTWLTFFTTRDACASSRIREFRMDSVGTAKTTSSGWVVPVTYSVLPTNTDQLLSRWLVANGERRPDGWIGGKSTFLSFRRDAGTLVIEQMTTSPPPATSTEPPR